MGEEDWMAEFRGLMQLPKLDEAQRLSLWSSIHRAAHLDPERYAQEWAPYLQSFPHHFTEDVLASATSIEELERFVLLAPFACFALKILLARAPERLSQLATSAALANVSTLTIHGDAPVDVWHSLTRAQPFTQLKSLTIQYSSLGDEGLEVLASSSMLHHLLQLDLIHVRMTDSGLSTLLASTMPHLKHLSLRKNALSSRGITELVKAPLLKRLVTLDLSSNPLEDEGVLALAEAATLPALKTLNLVACKCGDVGLVALLQPPSPVANLTRLELHENPQLEDAALQALVISELTMPATLNLSQTGISDVGIALLANDPRSASISSLDLSSTRISDAGVEQLVNSPLMASLTHLYLGSCFQVGDAGVRAIADSPGSRHLTHLELPQTHVADEGILAIASSPYLNQLRCLDLSYTHGASPDAMATLLSSSNLSHIEELRLQYVMEDEEMMDEESSARLEHLLDASPHLRRALGVE